MTAADTIKPAPTCLNIAPFPMFVYHVDAYSSVSSLHLLRKGQEHLDGGLAQNGLFIHVRVRPRIRRAVGEANLISAGSIPE